MNKISSLLVAGFFLLCGIAGTGLYYHINDTYLYKEQCSGTWVIFNKNTKTNLTLDFMYSRKHQVGTVAINGILLEGDKVKARIRRDVIYDWTENQDILNFHSIKINKFKIMDSLSDEQLAEILPDFYVYPDKRVSYSVLSQGNHGFLFTIGQRPLFYCAR